jgi:hypothetical protein
LEDITLVSTRKKFIGLVAAVFGTAALLGSSVGVMAAREPQQLSAGSNFIGGPIQAMPPQKFTSCLAAGDWNSLYVWDAPTQQWKHYINPTKVPAYVNDPQVGGIATIPALSGLAILMDNAVPSAIFPILNSDQCP